MKDHGLDSFEDELRRLAPTQPPPALMKRLTREPARSVDDRGHTEPAQDPAPGVSAWRAWLRWLAPAAAVAVVAVLLWQPEPGGTDTEAALATRPEDGWLPEEIEVDRRLVAAFEGVARLPDGMPFRFRCYSWDEELVARDASGQVEVRQRAPRMEIIPVNLAVY